MDVAVAAAVAVAAQRRLHLRARSAGQRNSDDFARRAVNYAVGGIHRGRAGLPACLPACNSGWWKSAVLGKISSYIYAASYPEPWSTGKYFRGPRLLDSFLHLVGAGRFEFLFRSFEGLLHNYINILSHSWRLPGPFVNTKIFI